MGVTGGGRTERETGCCLHTYTACTRPGTRDKGDCVEIERGSGCIGFRAGKNSGPEAEFEQVKFPTRGPAQVICVGGV